MSEVILAKYKNIEFSYSGNKYQPVFKINSNLSSLVFATQELAEFYHDEDGELNISLLTPDSCASKSAFALMSKIIDEELTKTGQNNE